MADRKDAHDAVIMGDFWGNPWTISSGAPIVAALILWLVARLSSDFRVWLKSTFRWLRGLRIMTRQQRADLKASGRAEAEVAAANPPYIPPANWVITAKKGAKFGTFLLHLIEDDLEVKNVEVRPDRSSSAKVLSKLFWNDLPESRTVEFVCLPFESDYTGMHMPIRVFWDDANGERREQSYYLGSDDLRWSKF